MVRLLISVEGHSEYKFTNEVIVPHLAEHHGVFAETQNMRGSISIDKIRQKLNSLIHNHDFTTTLYDFYGFKRASGDETKQTLEEKIKQSIKKDQRNKIIPYIQMYEFEALLFSDNEKMAAGLGTQKDWIDAVLSEFYDIEKINNSKETAPSKRIGKHAQYIKTQHAPLILKQIGLANIRSKCQGFDTWLTQLENLSKQI
ncbi:DUF4276 family protein [thiotrophic endosymbiont of Bathymodiolus puteoserpentis (Logatchev)]|uniref:DUF4276 family protein n=1 Tax=thiotrophic endosymbiont of Bathymodiolus puteoserpentis (Logatchev) TaxID=343240 RepID=UPI0010B7AFD8|nr:DUF4276 family protein [thiotrophic endosymbiont of Bathymodiolus puteoserpentis (Logatchev)]CAC9572681.1 hypothetical protein [uncultured Gammaproteobacteria bacterium]SSC10482.1 hypothetical protein BPUTEOSOX_1949 [thiotrophic endosymbiont of Bathymodiolus puteoserpentis (Logatchev)]